MSCCLHCNQLLPPARSALPGALRKVVISFFKLFYAIDPLALCLRISGPASLWTTSSPAPGVLLSPVPFPLQNPAEAACPCSLLSRCGSAAHKGRQQTFTHSPSSRLAHLHWACCPDTWLVPVSQAEPTKTNTKPCAWHSTSPALCRIGGFPTITPACWGQYQGASTDPPTLHSTPYLFFPAHQPHSLMRRLPKGPWSSRLVSETASSASHL